VLLKELAGDTDKSGGWPTVADGGVAPNTGQMAKSEMLVATAASADERSADATAVAAMDVAAANAAAIGVNSTAVDMEEATNKMDATGHSVPLSCAATSGVPPADAGIVAEADLAVTSRARRWRHARRRFRAGGLGDKRPVAFRVCGNHGRAILRSGGAGTPDVTEAAAAATAVPPTGAATAVVVKSDAGAGCYIPVSSSLGTDAEPAGVAAGTAADVAVSTGGDGPGGTRHRHRPRGADRR